MNVCRSRRLAEHPSLWGSLAAADALRLGRQASAAGVRGPNYQEVIAAARKQVVSRSYQGAFRGPG
jgi:hypothetical protein